MMLQTYRALLNRVTWPYSRQTVLLTGRLPLALE
jgi:preprotein translocase subunit SecE